ncbi:ASKHA domain-containing protein [Slackia heliotrinireducens]|uniref:ASKHA domain-containing protein n=1 Tax=Slackia heliotrinireducens TaxID=84110 RepID=UPI003314C82F
MPTISVDSGSVKIECKPGQSLLDALLDANVAVDNPCNGKGTCGKCRVKVVSENPVAPTEAELRLLSAKEIEAGVRLACMVKPETDMDIVSMHRERKHEVLTTGLLPEFEYDPDISKRTFTIERPTLEDQTPFEDQACAQLGVDALSAEVLIDAGLVPGEFTAVFHDGEVVQIERGDTTDELYGVAIDIGTTTVVCELVNLATGEVLADASQINAQKVFGLDVLTRITYELEHPDNGIANLRKVMVKSINGMFDELCEETGIPRNRIYEIAVGANCTMMHMLLGVDAHGIGKAPFAPAFARAKDLPARAIGIEAAPGARLYCLPHVSAYIGADIVAGAYVCDLHNVKNNVLFIDIGTNGEIVLSKQGQLLSCSCAAGPALEGMNISAGMRAAEGAIEEITITEDGNQFAIIGGDVEPQGLCGSGILAVLRELVRCGFVRKNGAFVKLDRLPEDDYRRKMLIEHEDGKRSFVLVDGAEPMLVTQGDVRQVQLAKGAILSGFMALLNKAGIGMDDLDQVIIAGQFGAHLTASSITGTGILPEEVEDRIVYAGNTSKTGAYMALMSGEVKRGMERLAHEMDYMELGATENYERLFSQCMMFPDVSKRKEG